MQGSAWRPDLSVRVWYRWKGFQCRGGGGVGRFKLVKPSQVRVVRILKQGLQICAIMSAMMVHKGYTRSHSLHHSCSSRSCMCLFCVFSQVRVVANQKRGLKVCAKVSASLDEGCTQGFLHNFRQRAKLRFAASLCTVGLICPLTSASRVSTIAPFPTSGSSGIRIWAVGFQRVM